MGEAACEIAVQVKKNVKTGGPDLFQGATQEK
jgi:hypothetical protein